MNKDTKFPKMKLSDKKDNKLVSLLDTNTNIISKNGIYKKLNFHKKYCSCSFCATLVDIR